MHTCWDVTALARAVTIGGLVIAIGKFSGYNKSVAFQRAAIGD
jgi:hypothetical protein